MSSQPSLLLQQTLENEVKLLTSFTELLQQETILLLGEHDNETLHQITQLKNQYAEQLAHLNDQREHALTALQVSNSAAGLQQAASQFPDLVPLVEQLHSLAEQAKLANEQNGLLIDTYLQYNQQALDALAQAMQPVEQVYDARGKASLQRSQPRASIKA